jgi:hypothetical protein
MRHFEVENDLIQTDVARHQLELEKWDLLGHIQKSTDVLSGVLFDQNLGYFV